MRHEDLLKAVKSEFQGTYTPCIAATRYCVTNRKILQVATTLESIQEQRHTILVEPYNSNQGKLSSYIQRMTM